MIASLQGRVKAITPDALIVEVGGVGYRVRVGRALLDGAVHSGQMIELFTHMYVRENEIALYGFPSPQEQELFTTLLGVSGIGPRTALAILETFSPEVLRGIVTQGDANVLTRIPGIGRKTAQRLMLDLKDKIGISGEVVLTLGMSERDADVVNALTALGYSLSEAQMALSGIPEDVEALDERILAALQFLGRG